VAPTIDRRKLVTGATAASLPIGLRPPVAASVGKHAIGRLSAQGLPAGTALVTSPRLPLYGIGSGQVQSLLNGTFTDWRELGCPISLPVTVFGIAGVSAEEITPSETVPDYASLVTKVAEIHGAVAVVPLDQITLDVAVLNIEGDNPLMTAGTDSAPMTRIGFGGDILFGRKVGNRMRAYEDYTFPMLQLKDVFQTFDLTICNWECFVSETIVPPEVLNPDPLASILDFVTVPEAIEGVKIAGVDAVSMANNHAFYSSAGFPDSAYFDTARYLDDKGLPHFGAGRNLEEARQAFTTEINGVTIAIFGVDGVTANVDYPDEGPGPTTIATESSAGTNPLVLSNIVEDIKRLRADHDVVIPFFHMGKQYVWLPQPFAVDVTRACIDAGATAVVTSHPHTIMGMEVYKGKPIFHAIGNLVYDQMFSVDTRTGYILDMTLKGKDVVNFRIHGFENFDYCQGRLMPQGENAALLNRFWRSTDLTKQYRT
jgi:poly-gamma-glutamate synthesis protein (capsule biosynthesis protein)